MSLRLQEPVQAAQTPHCFTPILGPLARPSPLLPLDLSLPFYPTADLPLTATPPRPPTFKSSAAESHGYLYCSLVLASQVPC